MNSVAEYFRYWGKARPSTGAVSRINDEGSALPKFHLLAFHCLDVAACGAALIRLPQFSLAPMASALGWTIEQSERLFVFFLALHDLGKFTRAFQGLASDLSPELVPVDRAPPYVIRHDTLGWFLWRSICEDIPDRRLEQPWHSSWAILIRAVVGHHGLPPDESSSIQMDGGDPAVPHCRPGDREAALSFIDALSWLLPDLMPPAPSQKQAEALRRFSWQLAGIAVLADWLGSNQDAFRYRDQPGDLESYWHDVVNAIVPKVVAAAGLTTQPVRNYIDPLNLFDYLREPTPLQRWAATVPLQSGPQVYLLEDVTGAGKTEAALVLVQRLMQASLARGLYFALPSMATANQMYWRVGQAYQRLFGPEASPSLMLAHGARGLEEGFRHSLLQTRTPSVDRSYGAGEPTATVQCNAWLASRQKLALLADVGVGTIDQVLLGILPVRHQALRLIGLASKVLVVDEIHAYDSYMHRLLQALLTAHAGQGGSAILLSATMPVRTRDELLRAFAAGRETRFPSLLEDRRYPAALQAGSDFRLDSVDTRPSVVRSVQVQFEDDEARVLRRLLHEAADGHCVCWVRNTVADARRSFAEILARGVGDRAMLFHSRFAMGDRLAIEEEALRRFGKQSAADDRRGWILIATQVVEQSLDLDFDLLISDLAPVDLMIQRAGRLRRHVRDIDGNIVDVGVDGRAGVPILLVHAPPWSDSPAANWYSSSFPRASFVYPDTWRLWLTQRVLPCAGMIVSPGQEGDAGGVRSLVEAVYGPQDDDPPDGLRASQFKAEGARSGQRAQAEFNALVWTEGYVRALKSHWDDRGVAPTRLGEDAGEVVLVEWIDGKLRPICPDPLVAIDMSSVRIPVRRLARHDGELSIDIAAAIAALPAVLNGRIEADSVVPLHRTADRRLSGRGRDITGTAVAVSYDRRFGLLLGKETETSD